MWPRSESLSYGQSGTLDKVPGHLHHLRFLVIISLLF